MDAHEVPVTVGALASGAVFTWDLFDDLGRFQSHFHSRCRVAWILVENESPNSVTVQETQQVVPAGGTLQAYLTDARRFALVAGGTIAAGEVRTTAAIRGCH